MHTVNNQFYYDVFVNGELLSKQVGRFQHQVCEKLEFVANDPKPIETRVREWLGSEGYPLEFATAFAFMQRGFDAVQGLHVSDANTQSLREIDVVAVIPRANLSLFAAHIIECKWSRDKPWVVFSSERSRIEKSMCARHTIASELGESIMWLLADEPGVIDPVLFDAPKRPGFTGKQCFSKNDAVYEALQGVVSKARRYVEHFDRTKAADPWSFPVTGVIAFPVVVVATELFEAYFDVGLKEVVTAKVPKMRLHWRGAHEGTGGGPVSVDIVTEEALRDYLTNRAETVHILLDQMEAARLLLRDAFDRKSLARLRQYRQPGNVSSLPALMQTIAIREQSG